MRSDELYDLVTSHVISGLTDAIINEVIDGEVLAWQAPWTMLSNAGIPISANGRQYRGINAFWLPIVASERSYSSRVWGTYRSWQQAGAQVRKGEKGTHVFLWKQADRNTTDDDGNEITSKRLITKTYAVFNAAQVDNADAVTDKYDVKVDLADHDPIDHADDFFDQLPSVVRTFGSSAFYSPANDTINMPPLGLFGKPEHYYATLAHEHVHWTGHASRLDRNMSHRFGSHGYAAEELVAELGAAMWCAQNGLVSVTRRDHVAYLQHWVKLLEDERNALVSAASKAQHAVDYMNGLYSMEVAA